MATTTKKPTAKKAPVKKPAAKLGRRTKLDAERTEKLTNALKSGMYMDTAAAVAGLSKATVYDWLAKGRRAQEMSKVENREMTEDEKMFSDFLDAVDTAQAVPEGGALATIRQNVVDGDWRAAAWFLTHRYPHRYTDRVEVTGNPDRPIEVSVSISDVQAKVIQLLQERGAIENVEDAEIVQ